MANTTEEISSFVIWITSLNNETIYYMNLITIPFGLFFNTISLCVSLRKKFSKYTMGIYNTIISSLDILFLSMIFLVNFFQLKKSDVLTISHFSCKFFSFMIRYSAQFPSWVYIQVAIDRILCVSYQLKYRETKRKKFIVLVAFSLIACLLFTLNSPNLHFKLASIAQSNVTKSLCTSSSNIVKFRDVSSVFLRSLLPILFLILLNTILLFKLLTIRRQFSNFNPVMKKEYRFAVSSIILSAFFILFLTPNAFALVYLIVLEYDPTVLEDSIRQETGNKLYFVCLYISNFNYTFNFFINLKTNYIFRKEFLRFLGEVRKHWVNEHYWTYEIDHNGLVVQWKNKSSPRCSSQ